MEWVHVHVRGESFMLEQFRVCGSGFAVSGLESHACVTNFLDTYSVYVLTAFVQPARRDPRAHPLLEQAQACERASLRLAAP